ncbi:phage tail protein [Xanthomonas translucens pv. translucens]|uniref:phage tail protein n=1 Tax=Xanthomonas campestris pv. translucens TaxID=343 RepID=UPI003F72C12C
MTDTFRWRPTTESSGKATGAVRRAKFGDGYAQTAPDGINSVTRSYSLSFTGMKPQMAEIVSFLEAHVGRSFFWTPPFGGQGYYQCDEFSDTNNGGLVFTITATFEQTFQP